MVEKSEIDWKKDSLSFDTVAPLYDKFRPAYPAKLVDCIIEHSKLPDNARILEVGSGTGKATRMFASRGFSIHCIEPGANLATLATSNLKTYPRVTFEIAPFEQSQEFSDEFDLVFSAQAFHWVCKDIGYLKSARALKKSGAIALFWNMYPGLHGQIALNLNRIYHEIVPELESPLNFSQAAIQVWIDEIDQSGCFGPVTVERFPWRQAYQTREYIGLLNTYSDHLRLSEETRRSLFKAIAAAIDAQGGSIQRDYVAVLFIAQKKN
jgi:SAM-dependent methyltransferase